jgi:predicted RNase H-like nuclease (RuvC/YqgF family)
MEGDLKKTDTIRKRALYIYLPSIELADDWKERAEKSGTTISKWVIGNVMSSIEGSVDSTGISIEEIQEEMDGLKEENKKLSKKIEMLEIVNERLESVIQKYRIETFSIKEFRGKRRYIRDLIEILKKRKYTTNDEIIEHLNIDTRDVQLTQALSKQLEGLEAYFIIEQTPKGWRWIG